MPAKPSPPPLAPAPALSAWNQPGSPAPGPADETLGRASPASRSRGPASQASHETALAYADLALDRLGEMIIDSDPKVAFPACREILDRAWGKAEPASRAAVGEKAKIMVTLDHQGCAAV